MQAVAAVNCPVAHPQLPLRWSTRRAIFVRPDASICHRSGARVGERVDCRTVTAASMDIVSLAIPDIKLLRPRRFADARGWFMETWRRDTFAAKGIDADFVQDNQSFSALRGTVRGLHFQRPPRAQAKLVRVLAGRLFDVVIDLRRSSPHYGRHVTVELDAAGGAMLYIPVGFAHGFCTLTDAVSVFYKASDTYAPESEAGILWNDPALAIAWPVTAAEAVLSDKDRQLPRLADLPPVFD